MATIAFRPRRRRKILIIIINKTITAITATSKIREMMVVLVL